MNKKVRRRTKCTILHCAAWKGLLSDQCADSSGFCGSTSPRNASGASAPARASAWPGGVAARSFPTSCTPIGRPPCAIEASGAMVTTLGNAMSIGHNLTVAGGTFTTSASNFGLTIGGDDSLAKPIVGSELLIRVANRLERTWGEPRK